MKKFSFAAKLMRSLENCQLSHQKRLLESRFWCDNWQFSRLSMSFEENENFFKRRSSQTHFIVTSRSLLFTQRVEESEGDDIVCSSQGAWTSFFELIPSVIRPFTAYVSTAQWFDCSIAAKACFCQAHIVGALAAFLVALAAFQPALCQHCPGARYERYISRADSLDGDNMSKVGNLFVSIRAESRVKTAVPCCPSLQTGFCTNIYSSAFADYW